MARYFSERTLLDMKYKDMNCVYDLSDLEEYLAGVPTADVVPRAEVERLEAEIRAYSIAKKYDAEHFMADIKRLQMENNTLIKNRDKLLQSYAKGLFKEICEECDINGEFCYWRFLELKKKYTEGGVE